MSTARRTEQVIGSAIDVLGWDEAVQRLGTWSLMKYKRFIDTAGGWGAFQRVLHAADRVAKRLGVSIANVASRWVLEQPGMGAWVQYKLDQQVDHLLVDEGQDTSPEQWGIIEALCAEFFTGEGARRVRRTLFVVGDEKQSIMSVQGADVETYRRCRQRFGARVRAGGQAWLGPHIGDLENLETFESYGDAIARMERFLQVQPRVIAHDLHPDYMSTAYARLRPETVKVAVQHHHAHVVSAMAEHGIDGPAIGIAYDGTGCGTDGASWGGEILVATACDFRRVATFRPLRLVGGEQSVARYIKSHATRARDVMTTHVVCVSPDTPIAEVATLLEKRGIRRLPVVRDGELVGIVSRSNLVQALAAQAKSRDAADHSDGAIRRRLYAELER